MGRCTLFPAFLIALACLVALTGCPGDDDDDDPVSTSSSSTSTSSTSTSTSGGVNDSDLVIYCILMTPTSPGTGDSAIFNARVRNVGSGSTPAGVDITVTCFMDGSEVASGSVSTQLAPGYDLWVGTDTVAWTATAGSHNLVAHVDYDGLIGELNDANNDQTHSFTVSAEPEPDGNPTNLGDATLHWEAEDYSGGSSSAEATDYHDTTASNSGGEYRNHDVDIEICDENGFDVVMIFGEWMQYLWTGGGMYKAQIRYASASSGTAHIEVDGVNKTGSVSLPTTGGAQAWATVESSTFTQLAGGAHTVKFVCDSGTFNVNWFRFKPVVSKPIAVLPDLVVDSVSVSPSNPAPGEAVTFGCVVRNRGLAATPSGVPLDVSYSVDGVYAATGTVNGSLASGAAVSVGSTASWGALPGTHTVTVHADDINLIDEVDDGNNQRSAPFTVSSP